MSSTPKTPNEDPLKVNSFTKAKLSAVSKFKTLTEAFGSKQEPKIIFPPPSWFIADDTVIPDGGDDVDARRESVMDVQDKVPDLDAPEPTTFAMRIRHLIDLLPLPASLAGVVGGHADAKVDSTVDSKGPPIPDVVDDRTLKCLSSEGVMNGDANGASGSRQSVWLELERIKHDESSEIPDNDKKVDSANPSEPKREEGVMMYAPLEPTKDSEVELAESELEYIDEEQTAGDKDTNDKGKGKGKAPDTGISAPPQPASLETHWVPSTTKISIYTTWWGYRLYLPPPVMAALGSNQIKATQRAAMVTTALQWFLKKVPTTFVPPQLRPAVKVLQRLSPVLGYIGVFIAWSWTRITKYDKGNGVVLSATWLLPVALMPMSWDAGDIQGPPNLTFSTKAEEKEPTDDDDKHSKNDKVKG